MKKFIRKVKRLLRAPLPILAGYTGLLLSKLSPDVHQRFIRSRMRGPYRGPLIDRLTAIMIDLGRNGDQFGAMEAASDAIRDSLQRGEFDGWIGRRGVGDEKATLIECSDFLPGRSWKLQLFYLPEGHSHPPHSHSDVASCLVAASGTFRAREYDRHHDLEKDERHVLLSLTSDKTLGRGDVLLTTRSANDVHWFGAVGGPATALNFHAFGFARGRKLAEARRVYVDPTSVPRTGVHKAPKLERKDAKRRFGQQPLDDFPLAL